MENKVTHAENASIGFWQTVCDVPAAILNTITEIFLSIIFFSCECLFGMINFLTCNSLANRIDYRSGVEELKSVEID